MDMYQIEGARPLRGRVRISGSKNGCLPLLTAALLADDPTVIENVPDLRDIREMIKLVEHLGAKIERDGDKLRIDPSNFSVYEVPYEIMVRMRASFYAMGPLLARLGRARVSAPGGCAIGDRPVDLHLRGFAELGVQHTDRFGFIHARHRGLKGARLSLLGPNGTSVGATCNVLMTAVLAKGTTIINDAAREPEVVELCGFLNSMGASIEGMGTSTLHVKGVDKLYGTHWKVSPDRIEAVTYAIATLITHGEVTLEGVEPTALRPTLLALEHWGANFNWAKDDELLVRRDKVRKRPLQIVTEPFPGFPTDAQPQFTALLALTNGLSSVRETIYLERFMHVPELKRLGAKISTPDRGRIEVDGVPALEGTAVMASDLRAGASLVVAGLAAHGITQVRRIYHVERGYERMEQKLTALGARIERLPDNKPAPGLDRDIFEPEEAATTETAS